MDKVRMTQDKFFREMVNIILNHCVNVVFILLSGIYSGYRTLAIWHPLNSNNA